MDAVMMVRELSIYDLIKLGSDNGPGPARAFVSSSGLRADFPPLHSFNSRERRKKNFHLPFSLEPTPSLGVSLRENGPSKLSLGPATSPQLCAMHDFAAISPPKLYWSLPMK